MSLTPLSDMGPITDPEILASIDALPTEDDLPSDGEDFADPIDPEVLASALALPTEDDLPSDDGEPMDTPAIRSR